ncbi:MAG TPA: hypothetical protein DCL15_12525 [Chloroflexi bacterium]|nr:hypothetical protein [Chloroflexota bacterium]HHW85166.1 hypothetical protein [Chloroflexota bacterium]
MTASSKPIALVVFLENVGHITGLTLPRWLMSVIDWTTEEYAKLMLRLYGAYRRYDRVIILEDAAATGAQLLTTLQTVGGTHTVDLLLLAHGQAGQIVGYRGQEMVGEATFTALRQLRATAPGALDLRAVYGLNCYGLSLAWQWLELGAQAANGAVGVNWFPEPSLSVFLRNWLAGERYSVAVSRSNGAANRWWGRILRMPADGEHPWITSSRQIVVGQRDVTIDRRER